MTSARWAACFGFLFAVALVASQLVLDLPGHDDGDAVVNDFYAGAGGRARVIVAAYLAIAAGLGLVGFVWLAARRPGRDPGEARIAATLLAIAAAVLLAAAGTSQGPTYALTVDAFDEPLATLNRFDVHQSYGYLLAAYCFAGVAVMLLCREMRSWPRMLTWSGYAAGLLSFAAILFLPLVALPLWVAAAGAWLALRPGEPG